MGGATGAQSRRAEGAVALMEGTGNGTVDFMQTLKACEDEGIKLPPCCTSPMGRKVTSVRWSIIPKRPPV